MVRVSSFEGYAPWTLTELLVTAKLPGHYAVWAASDDAAFLHGRFTWTAWDVDDLRTEAVGERIINDEKYLRIGVHGL